MPVTPFFPAGHYHSPIVDPEKVQGDLDRAARAFPEDIKGIPINVDDMIGKWRVWRTVLLETKFPASREEAKRYFQGGPFPFGDAMSLRAVLASTRPRRLIEIGSGFSTACALDTLDEFAINCDVTCIEPDSRRLRSLVCKQDIDRLRLIESEVQSVPLSTFDELKAGDVLFIDSTHVLKTGSDVHFELFEILPRIESGVIVHFHDCPYPFEYPRGWVSADRNYSWNEAYAVRAFLTFNSEYEVMFWMSMLRRLFADEVIRDVPELRHGNPGSSLWIRRR